MVNGLDLLFLLGRPVSPIYGLAMKLREKMYRTGIFRQHKLSVPVVSVGNLVLGGTGKTPTVQHIVRLLVKENFRPAIISRGYKGKAKQNVNIVSNGNEILLSPELAGDEPYMLASSLSTVPVLTGTRRILPCHYAIDHLNCDIIILDDGFQHLGVGRDIDIVLFDGTALAGNSRILPGGVLREPVAALNRCHAFIITGVNSTNRVRSQQFSELLKDRFPDKKIYKSSAHLSSLKQLDVNNSEGKKSGSFYAFCGIANPSRFKDSLDEYGIRLQAFEALKDHNSYNQDMISSLCQKAIQCGAEQLVTTEKDFVKIKDFNFDLPLYVSYIEHQLEDSFDQFLLSALDSLLPNYKRLN